MREPLTDEQINRAFRLFYGDGMNLGQIMQELGCGLYDLTPWLTAASLRIAHEAAEDAVSRERLRAANTLQPSETPDVTG